MTSAGDLQRFRRNPLVTTASRIDFVPRWEGTAPRANRPFEPGFTIPHPLKLVSGLL